MRRFCVCGSVPALPLFAFLTTTLVAQTDTSSLAGRVTDAQAGGVQGAQITLRNQATGAERKAASDANGEYAFTLIPPRPLRYRSRRDRFSHLS